MAFLPLSPQEASIMHAALHICRNLLWQTWFCQWKFPEEVLFRPSSCWFGAGVCGGSGAGAIPTAPQASIQQERAGKGQLGWKKEARNTRRQEIEAWLLCTLAGWR